LSQASSLSQVVNTDRGIVLKLAVLVPVYGLDQPASLRRRIPRRRFPSEEVAQPLFAEEGSVMIASVMPSVWSTNQSPGCKGSSPTTTSLCSTPNGTRARAARYAAMAQPAIKLARGAFAPALAWEPQPRAVSLSADCDRESPQFVS
jgi:hypothetical protein